MLIDLQNVSKVKDFVALAQNYTAEITLSSGKYCVDGKSILGIFSLDLSKPVELKCSDEHIYADFSDFGV